MVRIILKKHSYVVVVFSGCKFQTSEIPETILKFTLKYIDKCASFVDKKKTSVKASVYG